MKKKINLLFVECPLEKKIINSSICIECVHYMGHQIKEGEIIRVDCNYLKK
ncbi:MAG: hypothetical protein HeimC3_36990 [Candidatus Heimdallarchaeota archaeon LC_3]|nr:MAG: hypothetical protein HeimC3_36990 [Candidatus Heimdallarchaeota archaeon LC_3]